MWKVIQESKLHKVKTVQYCIAYICSTLFTPFYKIVLYSLFYLLYSLLLYFALFLHCLASSFLLHYYIVNYCAIILVYNVYSLYNALIYCNILYFFNSLLHKPITLLYSLTRRYNNGIILIFFSNFFLLNINMQIWTERLLLITQLLLDM